MNLSHRFFIVTADDEIARLPNNHFERVLRIHPAEGIPEYARQRMRVAEIIIDLQDRKPVDIVRGYYWYLHFDSNGTADYEKFMRHGAISMEASMGGHAWFGPGTGKHRPCISPVCGTPARSRNTMETRRQIREQNLRCGFGRDQM